MPQPYPDSQKKHNVDLNDAALKRPHLAVRAAEVLSTWSNLEVMQGVIFTTMLGAEPEHGAAIYETIRSDNGRRDAFKAIADVSLKKAEDRIILEFILDRSRKAGRARDQIAHSLWGTQEEFPDCLLFVDPKVMASTSIGLRSAERIADKAEQVKAITSVMAQMRSGTTVWKEADFIDARVRIGKLLFLAVTFGIVIAHDSASEQKENARTLMLSQNEDLAEYVRKRSEG
jgi:hypothetical protein